MKYILTILITFVSSSSWSYDIDVNPFIEVGGGVSSLGRETVLEGKTLSFKVGLDLLAYAFSSSSVAVGLLNHDLEHKTSNMFDLELQHSRYLGDKASMGAVIDLLVGEQGSLVEDERFLGLYAGAKTQYDLNKTWSLSAKLQQRLDQIEKKNMLLNFGFRVKF